MILIVRSNFSAAPSGSTAKNVVMQIQVVKATSSQASPFIDGSLRSLLTIQDTSVSPAMIEAKGTA